MNNLELLFRFGSAYLVGFVSTLATLLLYALSGNALVTSSSLGLSALCLLLWLILFVLDWIYPAFQVLEFLYSSHIFFGVLIFLVSVSFLGGVYFYFVRGKINRLVRIGMGLNLFFAALFSFFHFLVMAFGKNLPSSLWFGQFKFVIFDSVLWMMALALIGHVILFHFGKYLRSLSFGREVALNLGVPWNKLVRICFYFSLISEAVIIYFFGLFAFVGLVLAHFLLLFTQNYLVVAHVAGFLLCLIDLFCYQFPIRGIEIPAGLLAMIFGTLAPLIFFLRKRN